MRRYVIASHAHFAQGIWESVSLLAGVRADVRIVNAFVDGSDDIAASALDAIKGIPDTDDIVVCTDLLGGSVNNEFTKLLLAHDNVYLVTNMNLPLLIALVLSDDGEDTTSLIRELVASDDLRVKFCNDIVRSNGEDEDF